MRRVYVIGMHGLGDNLHQRAIVRKLIGEDRRKVVLETPWPSLYHDLVGSDLELVSKGSRLRTQAKNAQREAHLFGSTRRQMGERVLRVVYPPESVRRCGSVLAAMAEQCGVDAQGVDFRLPVPQDWIDALLKLLARWGNINKPIMFFRPLVERKEWGGCRPRNPDVEAYAALFRSIRDQFFVVSVADLAAGQEWTVGPPLEADIKLHGGELNFEMLAALAATSALVFTSPGFALVLAQAVGTPVAAIFGGYENAASFSAGAAFTPTLAIEPIQPCQCFSHRHACQKAVDMAQAHQY